MNIEINFKNSSGNYDILYPKSMTSNILNSDTVNTKFSLSSGTYLDRTLSDLRDYISNVSSHNETCLHYYMNTYIGTGTKEVIVRWYTQPEILIVFGIDEYMNGIYPSTYGGWSGGFVWTRNMKHSYGNMGTNNTMVEITVNYSYSRLSWSTNSTDTYAIPILCNNNGKQYCYIVMQIV